jgi:hypothetical protein
MEPKAGWMTERLDVAVGEDVGCVAVQLNYTIGRVWVST